jgi:Zn-dependent peptidase ImmA (M78 family)
MMPPPAIRARFASIVADNGGFSARQLIHLAFQFHVSAEAMARWLERLQLVPEGTYNSLRAKGLSSEHVREVLGHDLSGRRHVSTRAALLAAEAHARGLRSEGQLADMLDMDRIDIRAMLAALGSGNDVEVRVEP